MRIEINDKKKCEQFNYIFTNLKYFTDKVVLHVSEEKIYLQGMDNNHICVYEVSLSSSWFTKYEVIEAETICIPLSIFTKILQIHNEKQYIIITMMIMIVWILNIKLCIAKTKTKIINRITIYLKAFLINIFKFL